MTPQEKERKLELIYRLTMLSKSSYKAEAATARRKARELMDKFQIAPHEVVEWYMKDRVLNGVPGQPQPRTRGVSPVMHARYVWGNPSTATGDDTSAAANPMNFIRFS